MPRKILLADDSVTAQNMGKKILADAGYQVTAVSNGAAALKKVSEVKPDILVLDVYMPGYGGLELCRRLKESSETASIPVLLTVGKLEPFKPEEATKARADAFIVKPFEATELVGIVKKLEDAIPAHPEPPKPTKFAEVLASFKDADQEASKNSDEKDSSWKNRLSIPKRAEKSEPEVKEAEVVPEEVFAPNSFRDLHQAEADELRRRDSAFTADPAPVASTAEVPLDISPEEIAAIKAAAAILSGEGDSAPVVNVGTPVPELENRVPEAASNAPVPPVSAPVEAPAMTIAETAPAASSETPAARQTSEAVSAIESTEPLASTTPQAPEQAKVSAAGTPEKQGANTNSVETPPAEVTPAIRWRAEAVALSVGEAELSLEQEMAKERLKSPVPRPIVFSDFHEVYVPAPVEDEPILAETPSEPEAIPVLTAVTKTVELDLGPEPPSPATPALAVAAGAEVAAPSLVASALTSAASAVPQEQRPPANEPDLEISPVAKAEMAAAWSNWREIRETVVGANLTNQIVEAVSAVAASQDPGANEKKASPETPTANPEAIADIVDSMLAELKPKLIEEIARKLRKE